MLTTHTHSLNEVGYYDDSKKNDLELKLCVA